MGNFRYKALTPNGDVVTGSIVSSNASEVVERVEYLGLVLIEAGEEQISSAKSDSRFSMFSRPTFEEVTIFTRDLALLMKAGARVNDALDLLASDIEVGRLRPVVANIKAAVLSGETFADAISKYSTLFPAVYVALVRVGETSGTLDHILETLGEERVRTDLMRRKLVEALRYPAFVLLGAIAVLIFFLLFVLPQFGSVLRDLGARLDPIVATLLTLSDFVRANSTPIMMVLLIILLGGWILLRQKPIRAALVSVASRLPLVRTPLGFHRTTLFCRNLGILLANGVTLTATLRILNDMMTASGSTAAWTKASEGVRHGSKLSDALAGAATLPPMAIRMLRLGEETGQLSMLAERVADFYEAKLQRSLDRVVAIAGPLAIILISTIVGGLIVSVMTALLSVSQVVG
jgi:general secretion pathway protein F